jgi:hypothetical protein
MTVKNIGAAEEGPVLPERHAAGSGRLGTRSTPQACALRTEQEGVPRGTGERFAGYGVLALPFAGGDILAFRRFPASSLGRGYTTIWHRDASGAWTFYVSIDPALACPRYFGAALDRVVVTDVGVTWVGHDHLVVSAPDARVEWSMRVQSTAATRIVSGLAALAPARAWRNERLLGMAGAVAGIGVGAGPIRLIGETPNGQRFRVTPRRLWRIDASAAQVEGRELGPLGGDHGADLADFRVPGIGLFVCGSGEFERLDPQRHGTRVGRSVERI